MKKVDSYWKSVVGKEALPYKIVGVEECDNLPYRIEFADEPGSLYWSSDSVIGNDIPSSEDEFLLYKID
tara:strand:- start:2073 stop:2279 length:207 start_codon:yes stop_codon:yes gene_type:complete